MASAIETHPQRDRIIEALAKGESCRSIAAWLQPPLHYTTVHAYAQQIAKIAKRENAVAKVLSEAGLQAKDGKLSEEAKELVKATQAAATAGPFFERMEWLWNRTRNGVERAETSVRVVKDRETGDELPIGQDFQALAAMLNQAHKNAELFGKATGALDQPQQAQSHSIVVIMPQSATSAGPAQRQIEPADVIECQVVERSDV